MKKTTLSAFTMLELLITMVISAILTGIAFLMFQIIQQQFLKFEASGNDTLVVDNFNRLFTNDLQTADFWQIKQKYLTCQFKSSSIDYQFEDDFILRTSTINDFKPDTFFIANKNLICYFNQKTVLKGTVDQCSVLFQFGETWIPVHQQKEYSARQMMTFQ